jgi:hypothetical protein
MVRAISYTELPKEEFALGQSSEIFLCGGSVRQLTTVTQRQSQTELHECLSIKFYL